MLLSPHKRNNKNVWRRKMKVQMLQSVILDRIGKAVNDIARSRCTRVDITDYIIVYAVGDNLIRVDIRAQGVRKYRKDSIPVVEDELTFDANSPEFARLFGEETA
jgi:hypothetical protein